MHGAADAEAATHQATADGGLLGNTEGFADTLAAQKLELLGEEATNCLLGQFKVRGRPVISIRPRMMGRTPELWCLSKGPGRRHR
jgi:hypothetical protein